MWQAFAIIVCMSLVNALRRTIFNIAAEPRAGATSFAEYTALGLLVGCIMLIAVALTLKRHPVSGSRQYAAVAAAILLSSALGVLLKDLYEWRISPHSAALRNEFSLAHYFLPDWLRYVLPGALIAATCVYFRSQTQIAAAAHQCAVETADMARRVAETRLRVLEAQIEPHFLFNTLASVKRLFHSDAAAADRMLADLMRYLSVALPRIRHAQSSLGGEADLASAFLEIHRVRMGQRMHYHLSIPLELRNTRVPPFMLLTLVENAIKHGIDPLPQGGTIDVSARTREGQLVLEVRDNGCGFSGDFGPGTGLANMRARLELVYGRNASLHFSRHVPSGVVATLTLPLEQVPTV